MKIVAIITEDFSLFHDLVKALKASNIPFISLSFKDAIPPNVGVVLTSDSEAPRIYFPEKIAIPGNADIEAILNESQRRMMGKEVYPRLIIGIDPGVRPGFAVVALGNVLYTTQLGTPEDVKDVAKRVLALYPAEEVVVRVGHGDPTNRNRVINSLTDLNVTIEIVDEHSTTKRTDFPDINAAINIAMTTGKAVTPPLDVTPTNGELKNLQRKSRELSEGRVTISTNLAERVAKGQLSLKEAIRLQEGKPLRPRSRLETDDWDSEEE